MRLALAVCARRPSPLTEPDALTRGFWGWGETWEGWQRVLGAVSSYRDIESDLLGAVERLIDFVTVAQD